MSSSSDQVTPEDGEYAIEVTGFSFAYGSGGAKELTDDSVLREVEFKIPHKSRVLIVGLNGSGKSTLLRCLSGQHFHVPEQLQVLGKAAFFDSSLSKQMTYLGSEWRNNALVRSDVPVKKVLEGAVGYTEERGAMLTELLNMEVDGSMHQLSDGQRQGVQIGAALMKEFKILLMDETTVECDVLVRKRLLRYLKEQCEQGSTVMYATHVFDGMASWPTHIMHVEPTGKVSVGRLDECEDYLQLLRDWDPAKDSPLSALVEMWLEKDDVVRKKLKAERKTSKKSRELTVEEKLCKTTDKYYNYWN